MAKNMVKKKIYIGADHAGFEMKEKIKSWLADKGYKVEDIGAYSYKKIDDYPVFAERLGIRVAKSDSMGILFCGSAAGVCIAANKIKGARAVAAMDKVTAKLSREHNDSNVLCLSAWLLNEKNIKGIIDIWLKTRFSKETRHVRRLALIKRIEQRGGR